MRCQDNNMKFLRNLFLTKRFYQIGFGLVILFCFGFFIPFLFDLTKWLLFGLVGITFFDIWILHRRDQPVKANRIIPKTLSLGYHHEISIRLKNTSSIYLKITVIDELPDELQDRSNKDVVHLVAGSDLAIVYLINPVVKGLYSFHNIICLLSSGLELVMRRISVEASQTVPVYPSIKEMQENEFVTFGSSHMNEGSKRIRRVGQSLEFDHIKNYTEGDDYQKVNWKASSKGSGIMVNYFEDERAQPIYMIIDKSRAMKMAFKRISLLSYSINAVLSMSNIVLKKFDRAGFITFANTTHTFLKAAKNKSHLKKILKSLYKEKEGKSEANFEELYQVIRRRIPNRSLLFLFTNFESKYAMQRVLPILRLLSKRHLLVVILFENTEVIDLVDEPISSVQKVYDQTMAEKYIFDKRSLVRDLKQHGIQAILTKPQDLSAEVIKKYLELKSRVAI